MFKILRAETKNGVADLAPWLSLKASPGNTTSLQQKRLYHNPSIPQRIRIQPRIPVNHLSRHHVPEMIHETQLRSLPRALNADPIGWQRA